MVINNNFMPPLLLSPPNNNKYSSNNEKKKINNNPFSSLVHHVFPTITTASYWALGRSLPPFNYYAFCWRTAL